MKILDRTEKYIVVHIGSKIELKCNNYLDNHDFYRLVSSYYVFPISFPVCHNGYISYISFKAEHYTLRNITENGYGSSRKMGMLACQHLIPPESGLMLCSGRGVCAVCTV